MFSLEHLSTIRNAEIEAIAPLFPAGSRILEVGAGTGHQALNLQRRGYDVTAIEIAASNYAADRVFPIVDYDGAHIPLPDQSFDIVFSSNVLEHVPNLVQLHTEIRRVLKPGGFCLHVLPTHGWRFWTTVSIVPDAMVYFASMTPQLIPRALPRRTELRRLLQAWNRTAHRLVGYWPVRHGERGNLISETWYFHPSWWRRNFQSNGFAVIDDRPLGLFYTGNMALGSRLSLAMRARLALVLGSACHVFKLGLASKNAGG